MDGLRKAGDKIIDMDADYAKASTELARSQILQQAGTAILAQANASQQVVLQLLNG